MLVSLGLLLVAASFLAASPDPAAARGFSALAVDAHTGKVLFSQAPDAQRHPASLTKVMTLYILFEEISAGRMTLATKLGVSRHAAARPPSGLGLKAGETISVENAIKALITRSANDVAAAIGENISGSETAFALRMTKTARSIGMTRTTFRNASGLPDPAQVTTARDMATLGLRIQRDFPGYYPYFKIRSFTYNGRIIRTHNRLLGRFNGTDGIKTGYIRASGFNLTTSAARGGKRMIGVVMGANSGSARNQYMMKMLDKHFTRAKTSKNNVIAALAGIPPGVGPGALAEFAAVTPQANAPAPPDPPVPIFRPTLAAAVAPPSVSAATVPVPPAQVSPGLGPADAATLTSLAIDAANGVPPAAIPKAQNDGADINLGDDGPESESSDAVQDDAVEWPKPASASKSSNNTAVASAASASESLTPEVDAAPSSEQRRPERTSWNIQVGAYPKAKDARRRLDEVRALKLAALRQKTALAMPISKGKSTLYRARFLGFSEKSARETCRQLSKRGVECLTLAPQG
jgi:D-alanyl-D-alanine carboxypeptidase